MRYAMILILVVVAATTSAYAENFFDEVPLTMSAGANLLTATDTAACREHTAMLLTGNSSGSSLDGLTVGWLDSSKAGWYGAQIMRFHNVGSVPITIAHHSSATGVDSSNWITTLTGSDLTLAPGEWITLMLHRSPYDFDTGYTYFGWYQHIDRETYRAAAPTQPSRSIGTAWQPNANRATLVVASLSATCSLTLTGGSAGHIDVLVGSTSSPTTVIGSVPCQNTGAVVVGVNSTTTTGGAVSYIVRPGDWVKVTTTNTTGTPGYSLAVTEESL